MPLEDSRTEPFVAKVETVPSVEPITPLDPQLVIGRRKDGIAATPAARHDSAVHPNAQGLESRVQSRESPVSAGDHQLSDTPLRKYSPPGLRRPDSLGSSSRRGWISLM